MIRLKFERTKRGWSQQECAARAKMHGTEISRIENGRARPWPTQEPRLFALFGIPVEDLLKDVEITIVS